MQTQTPKSLIIISIVVFIFVMVIILPTLLFEDESSTLVTTNIKEKISLPDVEPANIQVNDDISVEWKMDNTEMENKGAKNIATKTQNNKPESKRLKRQVKRTKEVIVKATQETNKKVQDKVEEFFKNREIGLSNLPDDMKISKVDTINMITSRTITRIENFLENRN